MNVTLWVLQILLTLGFLAAGTAKMAMSDGSIRENYFGTEPRLIRMLGIAEVLGALGLVLPGVLGVLPFLTPLAATCLALVMLGAVAVHVRRKEFVSIAAPCVFLVLCLFVAVGRFVLFSL